MRDGVDGGVEIDLPAVLGAYRNLLSTHRDGLNAMNVFPVADSDTGNNMLHTVDAILEQLEGQPDQGEVATAIARGGLEGRGNSGLLLGQYLTGFASGLTDGGIEEALKRAAEPARQALAAPVEGTLVSVADAAALGSGIDAVEVVADARGRAAMALARTPAQLPVLAEAGVLDSGGCGLSLFLDALWLAVIGLQHAATDEPGDLHPDWVASGFELQFSIEAPDRAALVGSLEAIGDSVIVAQTGDRMSAHVHVVEAGSAIAELATVLGEVPANLRVEPLLQSVVDSGAGR